VLPYSHVEAKINPDSRACLAGNGRLEVMKKSLHFQIDPHSGIPIYRQIMDQIRYYIASKTLMDGDQLPSIREMSQSLTVNPTTIVKAYNELAHEKALELRHGKGAFVLEGASTLSDASRTEAIRKSAQRLVVEATQLGAELEETLEILASEWEQTRGTFGAASSFKESRLAGSDSEVTGALGFKRKSAAS